MMPYKVTLTLVGGERGYCPDICDEPTPNIRDTISVMLPNGATRAVVTTVQTFPSKSPGTAVETVDEVHAQEL